MKTMYLEKKKIGNNIYNYLKVSARVNNKVRTKTVAYLGKESMTKKELEKKIAMIPKSKIEEIKKELKNKIDFNKVFLSKEQQTKLKEIKKDFSKKLKLNINLVEDMFKDFKTYYIYNTNSIEGNTLTLEETNLLLNQNITPKGKDLKEIYDHINERETFDYLLKEKPELNINLIINIHAKLLKNIDQRIGNFRKHNVRVFGASFDTTDAKYVLTDMKILLRWYNQHKKDLHPVILSAIFHEKFERIHPFYDGNGRTGRMLINLILLRNNFPPLIIKNKDRKDYYDALSEGHRVDLTKIEFEGYQKIVSLCYNQLLNTYQEIFSKWG